MQYFARNCHDLNIVGIGEPGGAAQTMTNDLMRAMRMNISLRVTFEQTQGDLKAFSV